MSKNIFVVFSVVMAFMIFKNSGVVASSARGEIPAPVYVSKMPLGDYTLFATGGWDGNWYVGSNQAWIEKINLSGYKRSDFKRAYIGAKLGRMKSEPLSPTGPTWVRKAYKGTIYCAVSSTPSWLPGDYFLLTPTEDIPLQYDYENAIKEVGEARWFWTEIPVGKLNFSGDNYIIIWSPEEYLNSASSAPILAAAWGTKDVDTWINTSINPSGKPYLIKDSAEALKTPVTIFEPAIALKLIPSSYDDKSNVNGKIEISPPEDVSPSLPVKKVTVFISGVSNVERVWLEASDDGGKSWRKISPYLYQPPYILSINPSKDIPYRGKISIRGALEDIYGGRVFSRENFFEVKISTTNR